MAFMILSATFCPSLLTYIHLRVHQLRRSPATIPHKPRSHGCFVARAAGRRRAASGVVSLGNLKSACHQKCRNYFGHLRSFIGHKFPLCREDGGFHCLCPEDMGAAIIQKRLIAHRITSRHNPHNPPSPSNRIESNHPSPDK